MAPQWSIMWVKAIYAVNLIYSFVAKMAHYEWPWLNHIKQAVLDRTFKQSLDNTSMMKVLFALNLVLLPLLAMGQEVNFASHLQHAFLPSAKP